MEGMSLEFYALNISFNGMSDRVEQEYNYLVNICQVDGELLHAGWLERQCKMLWPTLTDNDINKFIQTIGWH